VVAPTSEDASIARGLYDGRDMATIRRSISMRAAVDRVFDYLADPGKLPAIWPSLVAVRNVVVHANGSSFDWDYKLMGMKIHGHSDPVELIKNERLVTRSATGIPNTFRWLFAARAELTEVTLEVDYQVPVLGRLAEGLVGRINQREAEVLLANLKRTLEA
jgi:uncharacterized membrane protein